MGRKIKPGVPCYACTAQASSKDHCPPKLVFPADMRVDLIKVPACEQHNQAVSADDEYAAHVLTMAGENNDVGQRMMLTTTADAMKYRDRREQVIEKVIPVKCADGDGDHGLTVDRARFNRVMVKIARGLYYHENDYLKRLDGPFGVFSNMFRARRQAGDGSTMAITSPWAKFAADFAPLLDAHACKVKGSNPKAFSYQISPAGPPDIVRLIFYGGVEVAVVSSPQMKGVAGSSNGLGNPS